MLTEAGKASSEPQLSCGNDENIFFISNHRANQRTEEDDSA
jgi:hypothetical protein